MANELTVSTSKKPWESKTILVSAFSMMLGGAAMLIPQAQVAYQWLDSHGASITVAWGAIAAILRFITKDKIQLRD